MNYDLNNGYKKITTSNSASTLVTINSQLNQIKNGQYTQSNRESYCVDGHDQPFDNNLYKRAKENGTFRKEEWMCKMCKGKEFKEVGYILDYQVPLKHDLVNCKGMGKIDLLSKLGNTAYLLELKVPDSTESPLRAIMEVYTYWQQLGGNKSQNFLDKSAAKGAQELKKGIVIFEKDENESSKYLYTKLIKDKAKFTKLMNDLEVECFIATLEKDNNDCNKISNIRKWKL